MNTTLTLARIAGSLIAIFWRLALGVLLTMLTWQVYQLRTLPTFLHNESVNIQRTALSAVQDVRQDLVVQMSGLRADLMKRADIVIADSHKSVLTLTAITDERLQDLTVKVNTQLSTLVAPTKNVLDVVSENVDLLGRCAYQDAQTGEWYGNQDCLANRIIPALKNFEHMSAAGERMAVAIEKEVPATAKAVRKGSQQLAGIAEDGHKITSEFTKKQPWWKRALNVLTSATALAAKVL